MSSDTKVGNMHQENNLCSPSILKQHEKLKKMFSLTFLNSLPNATFIVTRQRGIVLYNKVFMEIIGEQLKGKILGSYPGELLQCTNALKLNCGESLSCAQCGVNKSIQTAFEGHEVTEECMLLSEYKGVMNSYTFMVHASPLTIGDESYAIVHLTDITDRKNKEIMEKIFLHDLMNAVNGITCAGNLLKEKTSPETSKELAGMVVDRAELMINEINAHRLFISAENKQLKLQYETVDARKTIDSVCTFFAGSSLAKKLNITISQEVDEFKIVTDQRILYRILENLIKNAIESSPEHKTITVKASKDNKFATFSINNKKTIQKTVASQIFKRSFSTKGTGRGLGTYSVKLFTENYLSGKVWFESSEEEGTIFYVKLPIIPN